MADQQALELEFWSDSFHEGDWSCEQLANHLQRIDFNCLNGFIPRYSFRLPDNRILQVTVYGAYNNWIDVPPSILNLLEWGKPDLVVYSPSEDSILLAVEETAAVPTGNQALQRFERIYGSARARIPFWYLVGEYAMHIDRNVRRDSIWPVIGCLKLTSIYRSPAIVLHYSERTAPEDYAAGTGLQSLSETLSIVIQKWAGILTAIDLANLLEKQYLEMLSFVCNQWSNVVEYLPEVHQLEGDSGKRIANVLAQCAVGHPRSGELSHILNWGKVQELPKREGNRQTAKNLIKPDRFLEGLEQLIANRKAYTTSNRTGSRPQPEEKINYWINRQQQMFSTTGLHDPPTFSMRLEDFPHSLTGLRHVTTARNILYLCDNWNDVENVLISVFPRLNTLEKLFDDDQPVMVYVSNSITPGRIFGDPFTGQLTSWTMIFARNMAGDKSRKVIAYYPHQVHSQLVDRRGNLRRNKGVTLLTELADLLIFHGGVAVCLANAPKVY